jgi:hypothetical protein
VVLFLSSLINSNLKHDILFEDKILYKNSLKSGSQIVFDFGTLGDLLSLEIIEAGVFLV